MVAGMELIGPKETRQPRMLKWPSAVSYRYHSGPSIENLERKNEMSSAFVLMPFDEGFAPVYSEFIKPVLESVGVVVSRADNIESQQNILRDVMGGIGGSDLIIADLTSSNPNVYYELGVAHASRKPVIHLTQSLEEVPFDLRSHRLIEYSTHFSKIEEAREKLRNYAEAFLRGELLIGSPVTDFLSRE